MELKYISHSAKQTKDFAELIATMFVPGDIVTLTGDLGAGKTTFVSGVAKALRIDGDILSPTFNIMKCYFNGKIPMYHIDAYRLEDGNKDIGLEEFIEGDGVCLIEWPNFIKEFLVLDKLEVRIVSLGSDDREITLISSSKHFDELIKNVEAEI